jgi:formylglycine-generating enzyme required for sulfatase activity
VSEVADPSVAAGPDSLLVEELGNGVVLEMAPIPGGQFVMGAPAGEPDSDDNERPQHRVSVPPFRIGRYAVTIAQRTAVMGALPEPMQRRDQAFAASARQPVVRVSWNEADAFCMQLSTRTGRTYRLPSEAEWEYACRAGTTTPFAFGATISPALANYDAESRHAVTVPVGSLGVANAFGLFDMHGNVWEWCHDRWNGNYDGAPADGSAWTTGDDERTRVLRGGAWASSAGFCRSAARSFAGEPTVRSGKIGFRVAMSAPIRIAGH